MRIRSTHGEQWTDDRFVACSPLARLLSLALRNEADDNGIFEWNPIKIRMRLLPSDDSDIPGLLAELTDSDQVLQYEVNGKPYGIIRNFQRFQSPRMPSFKHPIPLCELPSGYAIHSRYGHSGPVVEAPKKTRKTMVPAAPKQEEIRGATMADTMKEIIDAWNVMAKAPNVIRPEGTTKKHGTPLPLARMTDNYKAALRQRLKDKFWRDNWRKALALIPKSEFLCGGTGYRIAFKKFVKPDTVAEIIGGNYQDAKRKPKRNNATDSKRQPDYDHDTFMKEREREIAKGQADKE